MKVIDQRWSKSLDGWVVVFDEPPMKYICLFDKYHRIKRPADSIVILDRVEEVQDAFDEWLMMDVV